MKVVCESQTLIATTFLEVIDERRKMFEVLLQKHLRETDKKKRKKKKTSKHAAGVGIKAYSRRHHSRRRSDTIGPQVALPENSNVLSRVKKIFLKVHPSHKESPDELSHAP